MKDWDIFSFCGPFFNHKVSKNLIELNFIHRSVTFLSPLKQNLIKAISIAIII